MRFVGTNERKEIKDDFHVSLPRLFTLDEFDITEPPPPTLKFDVESIVITVFTRTLYFPKGEQELKTIATHKRQRYCFIAEILDADHTIPEESITAKQKALLETDTLENFEGGKRQKKN